MVTSLAIETDFTMIWLEETDDQIEQGAFPTAGRSDDG
jgi:hypothetical protein